jgi:hypothetical protein
MMLRRIGVAAGREFRRFHSVGVATARNWKYGRGIAHKLGWAGLDPVGREQRRWP